MSILDTERILNQNKKKQLIISFDNLKNQYCEDKAKEHKSIYKDQPLSFILENSVYIFPDPFCGLPFFKDDVMSNKYMLAFGKIEEQLKRVESYIENYIDEMPVIQKELFLSLKNSIESRNRSLRNCGILYRYIEDRCKSELMDIITDRIYEMGITTSNETRKKQLDDLYNIITKDCKNIFIVFLLSPFLTEITGDDYVTPNINRFFHENISETIDEMELDMFSICNNVDLILILSKLIKDSAYKKAVSSIPNPMTKKIISILTETSVKEELQNLFLEKSAEPISYYSTPESAVNSIFEDDAYFELAKEDIEKEKRIRLITESTIIGRLSDLVLFEYYDSDNTENPINGYNYFNEGTTITDALLYITEKQKKIIGKIGNSSSVVAKHTTNMREDDDSEKKEDEKDDDFDYDTSEKPKKPEIKNTANKIQFKAMDAEAKQLKKMADTGQKVQEVKNAAKAVSKLPENVADSIKDTVSQLDEKDTERRKKYMIAPGFRKKIFKNLKLALLYGSAAQIKLALLPVTMVARHFSKEKDRRIRRELARELETEIKIVDEKISDASANGDQKEKYKLMRIKSDLEAEALRVSANSRYI